MVYGRPYGAHKVWSSRVTERGVTQAHMPLHKHMHDSCNSHSSNLLIYTLIWGYQGNINLARHTPDSHNSIWLHSLLSMATSTPSIDVFQHVLVGALLTVADNLVDGSLALQT